ncbi:MAG: carbohydrate ABC transporter permease, partial [Oscillospiraceae bacterium]|nr:carbohydrate ABC transporter permease [Oscillospiraceae bacterium]
MNNTAVLSLSAPRTRRVRASVAVVHAILIIGCLVMILPFVWMILTSFKSEGESLLIPPTMLPRTWILDGYKEVVRVLPMGKLYLNTVLLMLYRILCAAVFSSMAGFAFAKLEFPLKKILFGVVLTQLMLPSQIFIIPQYVMLSNMKQLNTIFALVFPGLVSAFGTFFMRQYYMSL